MVIGTTPILRCRVKGVDILDIENAVINLRQNDMVLVKEDYDTNPELNCFEVYLSKEETEMFKRGLYHIWLTGEVDGVVVETIEKTYTVESNNRR